MATITKEEYVTQLKEYVAAKLADTPHDHESLSFWANFNRESQVEFDAMLAANNITVMG